MVKQPRGLLLALFFPALYSLPHSVIPYSVNHFPLWFNPQRPPQSHDRTSV